MSQVVGKRIPRILHAVVRLLVIVLLSAVFTSEPLTATVLYEAMDVAGDVRVRQPDEAGWKRVTPRLALHQNSLLQLGPNATLRIASVHGNPRRGANLQGPMVARVEEGWAKERLNPHQTIVTRERSAWGRRLKGSLVRLKNRVSALVKVGKPRPKKRAKPKAKPSLRRLTVLFPPDRIQYWTQESDFSLSLGWYWLNGVQSWQVRIQGQDGRTRRQAVNQTRWRGRLPPGKYKWSIIGLNGAGKAIASSDQRQLTIRKQSLSLPHLLSERGVIYLGKGALGFD